MRIRPVDAPPGDDAVAPCWRASKSTRRHADIAAALADLGKLDAATRAPAQDWIEQGAGAAGCARRPRVKFAADTAHALGSDEAQDDPGRPFSASVAVVAAGFAWFADRPGDVAITWMGYRIETSVMVAALRDRRAGARRSCSVVASCAPSCARPSRCRCFSATAAPSKAISRSSRGLIAIGAGDLRHRAQGRRRCGAAVAAAIRSRCC